MKYQGGKVQVAKQVTEAILSHTERRDVLIEPFVGGGGATAGLAPHFGRVYASDINESMVLLLAAVRDGWEPPSDDEISRERYNELHYSTEPSAERGFYGSCLSFSGRWFAGFVHHHNHRRDGLTNFAQEARTAFARDRPSLWNVDFRHSDYRDLEVDENSVVYCDPPYADASGYPGQPPFDAEEFWEVAGKWVGQGAHVFVSEYKAPPEWTCVMEKSRAVMTGAGCEGGRVDRLFVGGSRWWTEGVS